MSRSRDRYKKAKRLSWAAVEVMHNPPSQQQRALYDTLNRAYDKAQSLYPDGPQMPESMTAEQRNNGKGTVRR